MLPHRKPIVAEQEDPDICLKQASSYGAAWPQRLLVYMFYALINGPFKNQPHWHWKLSIFNTIGTREMVQSVPTAWGDARLTPVSPSPTQKCALQMCRCKHYSSISRDLKQQKQYLLDGCSSDRQALLPTCSGSTNWENSSCSTSGCSGLFFFVFSYFDCYRDSTISNIQCLYILGLLM